MKSIILAAWALVMRDYRVRFRRTLLGIAWFFVPLFTLVAMAMFLGRGIGLFAEEEAAAYFVRLLAGLIFWQVLADTWAQPLRLARRANMLLRAVPFDQRALLVAGAISSLIALVIKLPVLAAALIWFQYPMGFSILLLPLGLALLIAAGMALASVTLPISLGLLDIRYVMPFVQMAFLLATPIFYAMPESGTIYWINMINPFTHMIIPVRELVVGHAPGVMGILITSIIIAVILGLGLSYFKSKIRLAIGYIGR